MLSHFKIGHYSNPDTATGCTVIVPPEQNVTSAVVRGASPGTRELALLDPQRKLNSIHALVLTGGSAFGLSSAQGVMEALAAQNIGYQTQFGVVPIVPAAVIFDKNIGESSAFPGPSEGRRALLNATFNNQEMGNVGAGCGASVGKWRGIRHAMKTGIGLASEVQGSLKVTALTVVNAAGDIIGKNGQIIAGALSDDRQFIAGQDYKIRWQSPKIGMAENTVLTAVLTNARLTKQQAFFVAERAHYGIARRVDPSHTSFDGDVAFVISTNQCDTGLDLTASMAVHAVEESIIRGVTEAAPMHGLSAHRDLI